MSKTKPKTPEPKQKSLLEKLSDRVVLLLSLGSILLGAVGVLLIAYERIPRGALSHISGAVSEALIVTGTTSLIVSFALSDSVRLKPIIRQLFKEQVGQVPSASDMDEIVTRIAKRELESVKQLAAAYVLDQRDIYSHSITLLRELPRGEIRILMTTEEDLSTSESEEESEEVSGDEWVEELSKWLAADHDRRHLYRVIARRPQAPSDLDQVRAQLLNPFEGTRADQWVYDDPESPLSVMLLGRHKAVVGFLPRAKHPEAMKQTRFDYAVVVANEMLVSNLSTWFDERYSDNPCTTKVMSGGHIDEARLAALTDDGLGTVAD